VATKKCKYCQTEIDQKAKICPNCKKDQRGFFAKHPIITVILALFVLGIIISSSNSSDETNTKTESQTESGKTEISVKEDQEEKTNTVSLNEDIQIGEVKWKVTKAWIAEQLTDYSGPVKPSGKFLVVNIIVENLGKEMKTVTGLKVVDDKGREFTSYSKTFGLEGLGAETLYILDNINPNVPLTFADVYEIPADAKGLKLKVGDLSLMGSDEGTIDLGL